MRLKPLIMSFISVIALLGFTFPRAQGSQFNQLSIGSDAPKRVAYSGINPYIFNASKSLGQDTLSIPTITTITSDLPDPSQPGEEFIIRVSVVYWMGSAPGLVIVYGAGSGCSIRLVNGSGSCPLTVFVPGEYEITARYIPLYHELLPSSDTEQHTVAKVNTITTIHADLPDPSQPNQPITVDFNVASTTGGTPTGIVTVTVAEIGASCSAFLSSGNGTCTLALTRSGHFTLEAVYSGDDAFLPSSDTEQHSVIKAETMTTIISDLPDPSSSNQPFIVTFDVVSEWGAPTGMVNVTTSEEGASCSGSLESGSGECALQLTHLGVYTLTVSYEGDGNYLPSVGEELHEVIKGETTTSLLSDLPDPSQPNEPFTVNFNVVSDWITPTGTVTVTAIEAGISCFGELADGRGICSLAIAEPGEYTLNAFYSGSDTLMGSSAFEIHTVYSRWVYLPILIR